MIVILTRIAKLLESGIFATQTLGVPMVVGLMCVPYSVFQHVLEAEFHHTGLYYVSAGTLIMTFNNEEL